MINKADKVSMADFESCVWLWEAPGKTMAGALRQLSQKKFCLNVITGIIREPYVKNNSNILHFGLVCTLFETILVNIITCEKQKQTKKNN